MEVISNVPGHPAHTFDEWCQRYSRVVIVGSIIVMGHADPGNTLALVLGFLAVILGTLNVVGGFVVTNRMLEMFRKKKRNNRPQPNT